ncbi:hypothetical protein [Glutamicibacter sp. M10]|uniref:hypothetical protein n=1 Tax=Glutamicibacter sp. M10 TaxID=3023076 RepID=UPI0021C7008D|nr:hypothetical protein [Glutamicibacter sp. M10]UXN30737.1 hypothetical protein N6V40_09705 [Glutamicibacter sp. M10]
MSQEQLSAQPKQRRSIKQWLWMLLQVIAGVGIGTAMAKAMSLPEEQVALIGTVITLVTWLADEVISLPSKDSKRGSVIHGSIRFLALVGFIMALQSLAALNGFSR